jgi:hypothetical protein
VPGEPALHRDEADGHRLGIDLRYPEAETRLWVIESWETPTGGRTLVGVYTSLARAVDAFPSLRTAAWAEDRLAGLDDLSGEAGEWHWRGWRTDGGRVNYVMTEVLPDVRHVVF